MPLDCISRSRSSDLHRRDGDARAQRAMAVSYFLVIDGLLPIGVGGDDNFEPCTNLIRLLLLLFLSASPDDESKAEVDRFLLLLVRRTGEALALHFQADGAGRNWLLPGVQVVVDGTAPRLVLLRGVRSATR